MSRIAWAVLIAFYVVGLFLGVLALEVSDEGWWAGIPIIASLLLGAGTGQVQFAALALLAIPIAIPFGLPADTASDPVLPVWTGALALALYSAVLVALGAAARWVVDSRLRRRRASRESTAA